MAEMSASTVLNSVMSMEERVASVTARPRVVAGLLGFFGALTLFLVAAGLYGTIAFVVARRTPELGLRLSLGAEPRSILALVMKQTLGVTLVGIALGGAIAPWATRFLAELSFDAGGFGWTSLVPVFLVLFLVAVAAAVIPASRALRIDPVASLRSD
jgi:ABC-type antimicrobial peptide transport system permease subunit